MKDFLLFVKSNKLLCALALLLAGLFIWVFYLSDETGYVTPLLDGLQRENSRTLRRLDEITSTMEKDISSARVEAKKKVEQMSPDEVVQQIRELVER